MKYCYALLLCLCALLWSACEKKPNMSELLRYENENRVYRLHIRDGADFSAVFTEEDGNAVFVLKDGEAEGVRVTFSAEEAASISYDGAVFPIPDTELLRVRYWRELFSLSDNNFLWTIRKETQGGLAVYRCQSENVTVYVDAATLLPLKIVADETEIDVLSCEKSAP